MVCALLFAISENFQSLRPRYELEDNSEDCALMSSREVMKCLQQEG